MKRPKYKIMLKKTETHALGRRLKGIDSLFFFFKDQIVTTCNHKLSLM